MKCPFCAHLEDQVFDSRPTEEGSAIRRRRECLKCGARFTTYEKVEETPLIVIKRDGNLQTYDRSKVISCIMKACGKRPISVAQAEKIAVDVEQHILNSMKREVTSQEIGEQIMTRLKDLDEVAYVRFASVYKQFKDIDTFLDELKRIIAKDK